MGLPKRIKKRFENIITLYGRKPVLESLKDESIQVFRLHLSDSNKEGETINGYVKESDEELEEGEESQLQAADESTSGFSDAGFSIEFEEVEIPALPIKTVPVNSS